MRGHWKVAIALSLAVALTGAGPAPRKAAIFDFELLDTSLEGATNGPRADEAARLVMLSDELRDDLAKSGRVDVVSIAPVAAEAHASNLQLCGGCDVTLAQKLDADIVVTGWVQKVSDLIININVIVRDVHTGKIIKEKSVDIRGNTDESWSKGLSYLVRNYLLAPDQGVF
jgi:hypothetical protein